MGETMKDIVLVTLADKNYINPAKQLFSGAYFNAGWDGDCMILSHNAPNDDLRWFADRGILTKSQSVFTDSELKYLQSQFPNQQTFERFVIVADKALLFLSEFKKWRHILYLDADMMINFSFVGLRKTRHFASVEDLCLTVEDQFTANNRALRDEVGKNYNIKEKAFCSGLMVFNTEIIKEDTFELVKSLFLKYGSISRFEDQSIFNLFFCGKWERLPVVYMDFPSTKTKRAIITHSMGMIRLWNPENQFYNKWKDNFEKADLANFKKTPLKGIRLGGAKMLWYSFLIRAKLFWRDVDRAIGLCGIAIKNRFPRLYCFVKKIIRSKPL